MTDHRNRFLELACEAGALGFGEFTLKSGRVSPYFFNAGKFQTGDHFRRLAACYADALLEHGLPFDMLFGPAYKGIPLATAVSIALADRGRDVAVAFNRKETKTHGEGGQLIGAPLQGRVLIVDDVITAGTAVRESLAMIRAANATPCGVLIGLDRAERGHDARSAAQELADEEGVEVLAVAGLDDLLSYTGGRLDMSRHQAALLDYRARYGVGTAK
ncbi:MAG: orotate phosphoribosyltransferase [Xanthomonadales bacterium]|nr:orotate phosphoribosyltransferase [Xanthomonadales bacterium]